VETDIGIAGLLSSFVVKYSVAVRYDRHDGLEQTYIQGVLQSVCHMFGGGDSRGNFQ
jgi:hypothetical protein